MPNYQLNKFSFFSLVCANLLLGTSVSWSDDHSNSTGPIEIQPVSQYFCINRTYSTSSTSVTYHQAVKRHFYTSDASSVPSLAPGELGTHCHDINQYGMDDSPLYPRLGLIEDFFTLWNQGDERFYDQDANGILDINDMINERLNEEYGIKSHAAIFSEISWPNGPQQSDLNPRLGFVIQPWNDDAKKKSFCPSQFHYRSDIPVFRILGDLIGGDTEGLFMAERGPEVTVDTSGNRYTLPADYILLKERDRHQIGFYMENGKKVLVGRTPVNNKKVMFYWPADFSNPLVKKVSQKLYIIRHPSELQNKDNFLKFKFSGNGKTDKIPYDKRFACIPKR